MEHKNRLSDKVSIEYVSKRSNIDLCKITPTPANRLQNIQYIVQLHYAGTSGKVLKEHYVRQSYKNVT
jgi:hypothetical protein